MADQSAYSDSAVMPTYGRADLSFVRGQGSWLYTADDKAYLDCATGIAVNIFGHNDPRLTAALSTYFSVIQVLKPMKRL